VVRTPSKKREDRKKRLSNALFLLRGSGAKSPSLAISKTLWICAAQIVTFAEGGARGEKEGLEFHFWDTTSLYKCSTYRRFSLIEGDIWVRNLR